MFKLVKISSAWSTSTYVGFRRPSGISIPNESFYATGESAQPAPIIMTTYFRVPIQATYGSLCCELLQVQRCRGRRIRVLLDHRKRSWLRRIGWIILGRRNPSLLMPTVELLLLVLVGGPLGGRAACKSRVAEKARLTHS